VTKPARTLLDLRGIAPKSEYRRALRKAEFLRYPTAGLPEADGARSGLESSFIAFCRRHRLPPPQANVKVGPYTADFLWERQRVIVETDAFRTHGGPVAFEEDRERDLWLRARGFTVVRVTDRQLADDPAGLAASLRAILER
jgi:very-short-patch-repair endonuclease